MPDITKDDLTVAEEIYGRHRDDIDMRCVGCIAVKIAAYRKRITASVRAYCLMGKEIHDD